MIELKDGTYFKAIWNYEFRKGEGVIPVPGDGNLLGALFSKDPERKVWTLTYRFRYYVDDINDSTSQDTKNWYVAETTGDEASVWLSVEQAISMMALASFAKLNCVTIESDDSKVQLEKLQELPGMNIQKQPKPDPSLN